MDSCTDPPRVQTVYSSDGKLISDKVLYFNGEILNVGGFNSKLLNWVINGRGNSDDPDKSLSSSETLMKAKRALAEKELTLWETENLLGSAVLEQIASMWEVSLDITKIYYYKQK